MNRMIPILLSTVLLGCAHIACRQPPSDQMILAHLHSTVVPEFDFRQVDAIVPLEYIVQSGMNAKPHPITIDISRTTQAWDAALRKREATPRPAPNPSAVLTKPLVDVSDSGSGILPTIVLKHESLHYVLDTFCELVGLEWKIENGVVVVSPGK